MTIQAGMVGTDGILIASDTLWTLDPLRTNRTTGARVRFNASKIVVNHSTGVAASFARNMTTSRELAQRIIVSLTSDKISQPIEHIEKIGDQVLSVVGKRTDAHCLIACLYPKPRLFLFNYAEVNGQWGPYCLEMESSAIAGDNINNAIFWAERYYRKAPVTELAALAAHLVVSAHHLASGTIGGLEIVLCTADGIRRLSPESIEMLRAQANKWDAEIGEMISSYRQQFTYAPNVVG